MNTAPKPVAKKAAVKKTAANKLAAKKVSAKKAPAKKTTASTSPQPTAKLPAAPVQPTPPAPHAERHSKPPKAKLVRDSFTMPAADFALIAGLKARALGLQHPTKKSELLRAGLHALSGLTDAQLKKALDALPTLKAGRPKKNEA